MRYAQRFNRQRQWYGHVWQGRFFSSPLDDAYFWTALRYVECNPVRAGMVDRAEAYYWSSAAAHCGIREKKGSVPFLVATICRFFVQLEFAR